LKARKSAMVGLFLLGATSMVTGKAIAQSSGIQAGFLTCNVASGWGFVIGSSRDLKCTWEPQKGVEYRYKGHVTQFGADIGYYHSSVILWQVTTATNDFGAKSLVGTYGGATAGAAVGAGAGVSLLVGGFQHSVTLQPLAVTGQIGLNVAAGIQAITLTEVKGEAKGPEAAPQ
jgi:hypothetical protein